MGRGLRNILIGCLVLVIGVCLCAGGITLATGRLLGGVIDAVNGLGEDLQPPYDLASRPLPPNILAETLVPATVGDFERVTLGPVSGAQQGTYSGGGQVVLRAARYGSTAQAQSQVAAAGNLPGDYATRVIVSGQNPSFVRTVRTDGRARLTWSHGAYYFDVQAANVVALDRFMQAFPY